MIGGPLCAARDFGGCGGSAVSAEQARGRRMLLGCWPAGEHAPTYVRRAKLTQSPSIGTVIADLVRLKLVMALVRPTTRTYGVLEDSGDVKACARA